MKPNELLLAIADHMLRDNIEYTAEQLSNEFGVDNRTIRRCWNRISKLNLSTMGIIIREDERGLKVGMMVRKI